MKVEDLQQVILSKHEKVSKAKEVRSLIQKQRAFLRQKQSLTDFDEPVLFLARRDGKIDIYEKATAGKFVFDHSTGNPRFLELRPTDQMTFPYADKRVRCYFAHEDRPFAGWENPIVDSESVMLGYEKTKATDLKYQERIQALKNKGKLTWVYIIIGVAIAIAIVGFAFMNWIQPALQKQAEATATQVVAEVPTIIGGLVAFLRRK